MHQARATEGTPRWTTCVGMGGRHASEWADRIRRNGWAAWLGIGGRHASESAGGFPGSTIGAITSGLSKRSDLSVEPAPRT